MTGYIQMTPVPAELDKDEEVLDRIVSAVDGATDQVELRKAFVDQERTAFQEWSGIDDKSWRFSFFRGYPTLFFCLSGPRIKNDEEPKPPIEAELDVFLSELSSAVVYGDTGCTLDGVSFRERARWTITDEKVQPSTGVEVEDLVGQPPKIVGPILAVSVFVALVVLLLVLLA